MRLLWLALLANTVNSSKLVLRRVHVDSKHLNGAAQAKIYSSLPSLAFITNRGSTLGTAVPHAGNASLTVMGNLTGMPAVVDSWPSPFALEGQDMSSWQDRALVAIDLARGFLLVFNSSQVSAGPIASLNLSTNVALHVRLFHHPTAHKRYALVTSGEATGPGRLVYCDLTDPARPVELGALPLNVTIPEGVLVHDSTSTAYVGGCTDTKLATVDLAGLPQGSAPVLRAHPLVDGPLYSQMVSTPNPRRSDAWFALYGGYGTSPVGGVARFTVDGRGQLTAAERLLDKRLIGANRVALLTIPAAGGGGGGGSGGSGGSGGGSTVALVPLEHSPIGGLGVVRLAPAPLALEAIVHFKQEAGGPNANVSTTRCFCAFGTLGREGSLVHAFVAASSSMLTYELM